MDAPSAPGGDVSLWPARDPKHPGAGSVGSKSPWAVYPEPGLIIPEVGQGPGPCPSVPGESKGARVTVEEHVGVADQEPGVGRVEVTGDRDAPVPEFDPSGGFLAPGGFVEHAAGPDLTAEGGSEFGGPIRGAVVQQEHSIREGLAALHHTGQVAVGGGFVFGEDGGGEFHAPVVVLDVPQRKTVFPLRSMSVALLRPMPMPISLALRVEKRPLFAAFVRMLSSRFCCRLTGPPKRHSLSALITRSAVFPATSLYNARSLVDDASPCPSRHCRVLLVLHRMDPLFVTVPRRTSNTPSAVPSPPTRINAVPVFPPTRTVPLVTNVNPPVLMV